MTRWHSRVGDVTARLDTSHRTPQLILTWPEVDGWTDEGTYAFEQVLAPRSHARCVAVAYLGDVAVAEITENITATQRHAGEKPATDARTHARGRERSREASAVAT